MKRKNYAIWLVSLFVMGMVFGTFNIPTVKAQDIVNGGFETGDFSGWEIWRSVESPVEFSISNDSHSGYYAARGRMRVSGECGSMQQWFDVPQNAKLSFYYKGYMQFGSGCRLISGWSLFDETLGIQITQDYFCTPLNYTNVLFDLNDYGGHLMKFRIYIGSDGTTGIPTDYNVFIDDVCILIDEQSPVAEAEPEYQEIDVGEQAWFSGNGSYDPDGYIVSYYWDFGDGYSASGVTVTHSYTYPGNYTVTLTVTDNDGLTDEDTCSVAVQEQAPPPPPPPPPNDDDWPMFNHDPAHTGYSMSDAPDSPNLLWTFFGPQRLTSPSVANDIAVLASWEPKVYALDVDDGGLIWNYDLQGVPSQPVIANNMVFVSVKYYFDGGYDYHIYCFELGSGNLLWEWNANSIEWLESQFTSSNAPPLTAANNRIYFCLNSYADGNNYITNFVFCLDDDTGDLLWNANITDSLNCYRNASLTITNNKIFLSTNHNLYGLSETNGNLLWKFNLNMTTFYSAPAYTDNKVFIGNDYTNDFYCLNANNGGVIWQKSLNESNTYMTPSIANNKVIIAANDVNTCGDPIYALDMYSGNVLWRYDYSAPVISTPAVADNKVYCSYYDGTIRALNLSSGNYLWKFTAPDSYQGWHESNAIAHGKLFTSVRNKLYVLGPGNPQNQNPVADAQPDSQTVDVGEEVDFSGCFSYDPDGYIVSYEWDFDDCCSGSGVNVTHTYYNPGNYTVSLTVTDNDGATDTDYATVTVFSSPPQNQPPVAEAYPEYQTIDGGEEAWFSGNMSYDPDGYIVSYHWHFGDGTSGSGIAVTHTYNSPGNYSVTLTVTDNEGASDTDEVAVTVTNGGENQPPVAIAEPDYQYVDVGEVAWFWANTSYDPDGYIVSYHWNFGDGTTETGELVTHVYQYPGNYTVTLTVTDDDGATDSDYVTITVMGSPQQNQPPVADAYPEYQTIDVGEEAWFTGNMSYDPDGYIVSYHWCFGDGASGSGVIVTHTYNYPGNYSVTLTVTDDDGATDSDFVTVTVLGSPPQNQPPVADAEPDHQTVYVGEETCFYGNRSYDPDGYIVYYYWDFGDGSYGNGIWVFHEYNSSGNYTITLTVTDNEGSQDSDTIFVTVLEPESKNWSPVADAGEDRFACLYETLIFNGNGSFDFDGTIVDYHWNFGDGATAEGMIVTHIYTELRTFIVTLMVVDDEGATDTETCIIFMADQVPIMYPEESSENETLHPPIVIPEIEPEKKAPGIIDKQKPILIITAGLINIATFDEENERIVPVEVTAYYGDVSNVRIELIDDGGLEIEIIPIVQNVPSGEIVRFYLIIKEPKSYVDDEGRGITIKLKAVSEDTESNIEYIDIVITEEIKESPLISEVEIISTAGTISIVALLAILMKRRFL